MEPNYPGIPQYTAPQPVKEPQRRGRRKINIEYIQDKSRRQITFSKRKAGIMKKAYELATLTGTQVLLLVASESGHVYTFATPKLQPLITEQEGKNLIQNCLNAPSTNSEPENNNEQDSPVSNPSRYMQSYKNTKREPEPEEDDEDEEDPEPEPLPRLKTEQKVSDFAPQGNYPLVSGAPPFAPSYLNPQNLYGRQMPPVGLPPPSHHSSGPFVPNSHPGLVGPPPNFPPYGYSHSSQPTQQYNNPGNNYLMRPPGMMLPLSSSLGDMTHPSHGSGHGMRRTDDDDDEDEEEEGDED